MGRKLGRGLHPLFGRGGAGYPSNIKSPGMRSTSIPSGILMHPAVLPQYKWAPRSPLFGEGRGPHLTQSRLGRVLPPYQVASSSMQSYGRNRYGPKIGGSAPFGGGRAGSPSNTVWPGPRPTCMPSFILIRPAVWPQYTNVTDRQTGQDRTDNGPIA